ncbi:MAG: 3-hydroxyacyl-CoA dehydrogenase NAD-binding domain-containing protein [Oryzihumus sp.]
MTAFTWEELGDGVVLWTMDDPDASAITINDWFLAALEGSLDRLEAEKDAVRGVVLTSAKKTFSAGGDLSVMVRSTPADAPDWAVKVAAIKKQMRRLETCGTPVAAAVNGAALGGGYELALVCHHRVVLDAPGTKVGLPEITLGLLPGGGGVTRVVRMLGLTAALDKVLMTGRAFSPQAALELGLVDEVVADREALLGAAKAWVLAHPGFVQPWDRKGFQLPGGAVSSARPSLPGVLPVLPAALRKQTKGAPARAQRNLLAAAVEGAQVDLETALEVESQYCIDLICSQESTNIIQAMFFDMQTIARGGSRPQGVEPTTARKVVVVGAGMMGAGIAHACAQNGLDVVLKDVSLEAAVRGKGYSQKLLDKAVGKGSLAQAARDEVLARITPTDGVAEAAGADVVIEAVFEDAELKKQVFTELEPVLAPDALLASNTSTLPITGLATGVSRPEDFVGLHFFSPVDKMPLVEIVVGEKTSDRALARGFDLVRRLRKTPIVVNDSRGFFTSRVIICMVHEAMAMVGEGVAPASVEQAGLQAGYPVGPLALIDELAMTLIARIRDETSAATGVPRDAHPSHVVLDRMVGDLGRPGRVAGAGFYDYADGARQRLWTGLAEVFPVAEEQPPFGDLKERLLFAESLDAVRALDEGVLRTVADANVGSILGIGFPRWTGGVLQYVDQYGLQAFVDRARQLADRYGERFAPPLSLVERAAQGRPFTPLP